MLFLAIAMIAFVGNTYASNEIVRKKIDKNSTPEQLEFAKICRITVKDKYGTVLGTVYIIDVPDKLSCSDQKVKDRALELWDEAKKEKTILPPQKA